MNNSFNTLNEIENNARNRMPNKHIRDWISRAMIEKSRAEAGSDITGEEIMLEEAHRDNQRFDIASREEAKRRKAA